MADENTDPPAIRRGPEDRPAETREARLAKALRENLRRRKANAGPAKSPRPPRPHTQD